MLSPFRVGGYPPIGHRTTRKWTHRYPTTCPEAIPLGERVVAGRLRRQTRDTPHGASEPAPSLVELEACSGTQFDPKIVRLFVAEYRLHAHQLQT